MSRCQAHSGVWVQAPGPQWRLGAGARPTVASAGRAAQGCSQGLHLLASIPPSGCLIATYTHTCTHASSTPPTPTHLGTPPGVAELVQLDALRRPQPDHVVIGRRHPAAPVVDPSNLGGVRGGGARVCACERVCVCVCVRACVCVCVCVCVREPCHSLKARGALVGPHTPQPFCQGVG